MLCCVHVHLQTRERGKIKIVQVLLKANANTDLANKVNCLM